MIRTEQHLTIGFKKKNNMKIKENWRSPAAVLSIVSTMLSVFAIAVSIKSCDVSERSLALSNKDYIASRSTIYKAVINDKNDELFLSAIDSGIQIQYGTIYVPPQLDKTEWPISPPKFGLPLVVMRGNIEAFLDRNVTREKGYIKVIDQTSIPLVIVSSYVSKGESYSDTSLYQLIYTGVVSDESFKSPSIIFDGLVFNKRLPTNTNPKEFLAELWDQSGKGKK